MRARNNLPLFLSVLFAMHAHAQTPLQECYESSADRQQVHACLQDRLDAASDALADAHRAMLAEMERLDRAVGREVAAPALEASQRAFREYRDRTCEWIAVKARGGSGAGDMLRDCQITLAERRTRDLLAQMPKPPEGHSETPPRNAVPAAVADVEWVLVKLERNGETLEPRAGSKATLRMRTDGAVGGLATINRYFGSASFSEDGVVTWTGPMGSTQMAGPPELMEQEAAFLRALESAMRWRLEGADLLVLEGADGAVRLTFRR
jgi:heat shock protein HslJ